jgi:tetratricopeptide (TPR) repeat protein
MPLINKIIICLLLLFAVTTHAQTYPKYTTSKGNGTTAVKKEKKQEVISTKKPVEEPKKVSVEVKSVPTEKHKEEEPFTMPAGSASFNDLFSKAAHLYKEKRFEEAVKAYSEALAVSPDDWKFLVLQYRGYSYLGTNDYNKAINDCNTAIEKTKVPNKLALGQILFVRSQAYKGRGKQGDMERACADYKKAWESGYMAGKDVQGYEGCN